uniref:Ldh family oxidoreductase n=1 Tax=candidate division WOR-3 bacterium TaxID=2052148 RepID=A0A7C4Y5Q9_UNCW3
MVKVNDLRKFVVEVFKKLGVPEKDAEITTDVLILADKRGIESHGVARLSRYVNGIKNGEIKINPKIKIVNETIATAVIDGDAGLGQVVGYFAMNYCIKKAKEVGVSFVAVRNSNHYGIAGYYALMALKEDLIGISMTNSAPLVVPTFGAEIVIGTNPIAVAIPAGEEIPFVFDGATSTTSRGKIEVYERKGKELPLSWATDEDGIPTTNAKRVLDNLLTRKGGGLLPLGGADEEGGGHKGYGLSVLIDIFSGVLSGGLYGPLLYKEKNAPPGVCHFFGAMKIEAFVPKEKFKSSMDDYIRILKGSKKAKGKVRIYIAGEKEFEFEERYKDEVPLYIKVVDNLRSIGSSLGIKPDF